MSPKPKSSPIISLGFATLHPGLLYVSLLTTGNPYGQAFDSCAVLIRLDKRANLLGCKQKNLNTALTSASGTAVIIATDFSPWDAYGDPPRKCQRHDRFYQTHPLVKEILNPAQVRKSNNSKTKTSFKSHISTL